MRPFTDRQLTKVSHSEPRQVSDLPHNSIKMNADSFGSSSFEVPVSIESDAVKVASIKSNIVPLVVRQNSTVKDVVPKSVSSTLANGVEIQNSELHLPDQLQLDHSGVGNLKSLLLCRNEKDLADVKLAVYASDDDEEEGDEQFWELTDAQLKYKAIGLLIFATAVGALFSDPMVDVINVFGQRIGISPFYVSFIITPFASNASEVLAGLGFAAKKTSEGVALCQSSVLGGASMNATMALCVFMCLIYFRDLSWSYTAETIAVSFVTFVVVLNSTFSKTIFLWQGILVASLYPFTVLLIWLLESVAGLK